MSTKLWSSFARRERAKSDGWRRLRWIEAVVVVAVALCSAGCGGDSGGENLFTFGSTTNDEDHTFTFNGYKVNTEYLDEDDVVIEFGSISRITLDMSEVSRGACDSDVWVENDEGVIEVVAGAASGEIAEIGVSGPGFISVDDCDFGVIRTE